MSIVEKPPDRVIIDMKNPSKRRVAEPERAVGLGVVVLEQQEGEGTEHEEDARGRQRQLHVHAPAAWTPPQLARARR